MLVEDGELLPIFIKYLKSDNVDVMNEACWVITNMINGGSVEIIKKVIQSDHCIECYIDVINKIEDENLVIRMIIALIKCIEVESGLKELYVNKNLKEILEKNNHTDKLSDEYKKLSSQL